MIITPAPRRTINAGLRQVLSVGVYLFVLLTLLTQSLLAEAQQASIELEASMTAERGSEAEEQSAAESQEAVLREADEQARLREIAQEVARREAQLEQLRYGQGIYAPELQEAFADLGAYFMEVGDFERARETYIEALQIARINTGLYSVEQMPLIRAAAQADAELKDWEAADDLQTLHWHISQRVFEPADTAYLMAVQQSGAWRLRALKENLLDFNQRGLMLSAEELSRFYGRTIETMEAANAIADADLVDLLSSKTEVDLALVRATATTPYTDFPGTVSPVVTRTRCRNVRDSRGNVQQRCTNVQSENPRYAQSQRDAKQSLVRRQVRGLTKAIERLLQLSEDSPELTAAQRSRIESKTAELEVDIMQLTRRARSRRLF